MTQSKQNREGLDLGDWKPGGIAGNGLRQSGDGPRAGACRVMGGRGRVDVGRDMLGGAEIMGTGHSFKSLNQRQLF